MQKRYPFKFLDAYQREDKDFFFGREEEVEVLYAMLFQTKLAVVYGASGTGKTSLIQCGLSNKFQTYDWLPLFVRREGNLIASLDQTLCRESDDMFVYKPEASPAIADLSKKIEAVYRASFKPLYFIFDQFEELYVLGDKTEQEEFVRTIKQMLAVDQPVKIIFSIREEYLGHLYEFEKAVPELLRKRLRVEAMNLDRVRTVLRNVGQSPQSLVSLQPGQEDALVDAVFEKIKGGEKSLSIQLPYLQVFLDKLYLKTTGDESRQSEAVFTLDQLTAMGDLGNILRNFLEEQLLRIATEQRIKPEQLWPWLSPFVTLEGTKEPLSEAELQERLPPGTDPEKVLDALQAFVKSGILRVREQRYEIAHDALAKQLHDRRNDDEVAILEVQRLLRTQVGFKQADREYFSEKQLLFIDPYLDKFKPAVPEMAWIEASRRHVQQQKDAEAARQQAELDATRRRLRVVRGLLLAALVAMLAAGYFAYDSSKKQQGLEAAKDEIDKKNKDIQSQLDAILAAERKRITMEVNSLLTLANQYARLNQKAMAVKALEEALVKDSTRQDVRNRLQELKPE